MFYAKTNQIFTLLATIKYVQDKPSKYDYSTSPRPCHNFMFMLSGEGEVKTNTETIFLKKGDFMFIPKNTTYSSRWNKNTQFRSIHFNFSPMCDPFLDKLIPIQKIDLPSFNQTLNFSEKLNDCQFNKSNDSFLAVSLFYNICHNVLPFIKFSDKVQNENTSILPAIEYVNKNYRKKITVEELASLCFLSPSRFYYLFNKHTGISPIVYKNKKCILESCQTLLLDKNKSIEEISIEYGFESAVYFRRLFKMVTGKTPTEYRKQETLL